MADTEEQRSQAALKMLHLLGSCKRYFRDFPKEFSVECQYLKPQYQANNIKQVNAKQCNTEKVIKKRTLNRQANGSGKEFKPREVDTCDSHLNDRHLKDLDSQKIHSLFCILSRMQL
jgi:hypothetical protein